MVLVLGSETSERRVQHLWQSNEFCTVETWGWAEEGAEKGIELEKKACEKSEKSHSKECTHWFSNW